MRLDCNFKEQIGMERAADNAGFCSVVIEAMSPECESVCVGSRNETRRGLMVQVKE